MMKRLIIIAILTVIGAILLDIRSTHTDIGIVKLEAKSIKPLSSDLKPLVEVSATFKQKAHTEAATQPQAAQGAQGDIQSIILQAASKYGIDPNFMLRIAQCESTMGKNLRNPQPVIVNGVNYGHAEGVFQFIPSTWARMSSQAGYGGRSVYDIEANINTAAWAFSTGHRSEWECT